MHKYLPNYFIFLDQYSNQIFENNNTNIGIIYRNYNNPNRKVELIKIAKACKRKRYMLFVSNDIRLAVYYFDQLVKLSADTNSSRPEISEAKEFLATNSISIANNV